MSWNRKTSRKDRKRRPRNTRVLLRRIARGKPVPVILHIAAFASGLTTVAPPIVVEVE